MLRLTQAINQHQEQLKRLIENHNYLCKRFEKAEQYFADENISIKDKHAQQDNIIRLMKELDDSIQNIRQMGYTLTEEEKIKGVKLYEIC